MLFIRSCKLKLLQQGQQHLYTKKSYLFLINKDSLLYKYGLFLSIILHIYTTLYTEQNTTG